ncbi:hypothetical protein Q9K01_15145 [Qipengyuania sp. DY56-A-20]|jgi:hypothetical protein|uniref:Uncharacterized protein n=1 Tax=Qipengyuania benthica TaxID=3067651 RepID=A0ABT9HCB1_9SPHN|nr:hypothetical protein [Qipengyuania sp. DY56-A-20]MDP4540963.1 hypothetical protein [Qipengyuania sp. DY56-A-20]
MKEHLFRAKLSRSAERILCMDPVVEELTPEQLAALHVMKHEVLASIHGVYLHIPAEIADKLLGGFLGRLSEEMQ